MTHRSSARLALALAILAGCDPKSLHAGRVDDRLEKPPSAPTILDGPSESERVLALRDIVLVPGDAWRETGYDLDGFLTTSSEPRQGCEPVGEPVYDGSGGIDNAFGSEISPVLGFLLPPTIEADVRAELAEGRGTLLVKLEGWNGTDDDPRVKASIVQSVDGTSADPAEVAFETGELVLSADGLPAPPPTFYGGDAFYARETDFVAIDDYAYVRDGELVARVPLLDLLLASERIVGLATERIVGAVRLSDVTLVVLVSDGAQGCGGATLSARWTVDEMLATAADFGICPDGPQWKIVEEEARENADVASGQGADPREVCDAISTALRFDSCSLGTWVASVTSPATVSLCE